MFLADSAGNVYTAWAGSVAKYSPAGHLLWRSFMPVGKHIIEEMAFDSAGDFYVVLRAQGSPYAKIMKFSPAGELRWGTRCYDNPSISAIATDAQNCLYVAGTSQYGVIASITKFSADGTQLWNSGVADGGEGRPGQVVRALRLLSDGSIVLAGEWLHRLRPVLGPGLPNIIANPQDQAISPGGEAVLTVTVNNPQSVTYQWLRSGSPIANATNRTLRTSTADAYSVVVMNQSGFVISRTAEVTIPLRLNIERNGSLIRIWARGEPNVRYQIAANPGFFRPDWRYFEIQSSPSGMVQWTFSAIETPQRFFKVLKLD